jgi:CheY-like chemotaxis protein
MQSASRKMEQKKAILIVDDSVDDSDVVRRDLSRLGISNPIRVVLSCAEAISYLEGHPPYSNRQEFPLPSVILLDLVFPGMDGFQFLSWMKSKEQYKGILTVAVSGSEDLGSVRRAYKLGIDSFLTKPCRLPELENLIQGFPGPWTRA